MRQIMMTSLFSQRIWLCTHHTEMRKSFDGLIGLTRKVMNQNPTTGDWFVFVNRRRTMMKVLYFAPGGYCIWSKLLEQGSFARLANHQLSLGEWQLLIEGIDIKQSSKRLRYKA
jgi:transposase